MVWEDSLKPGSLYKHLFSRSEQSRGDETSNVDNIKIKDIGFELKQKIQNLVQDRMLRVDSSWLGATAADKNSFARRLIR